MKKFKPVVLLILAIGVKSTAFAQTLPGNRIFLEPEDTGNTLKMVGEFKE